jgi:hypothetical protein
MKLFSKIGRSLLQEDVPFAHSIPRFPALKKPAAFVSFSQKGEVSPSSKPSNPVVFVGLFSSGRMSALRKTLVLVQG